MNDEPAAVQGTIAGYRATKDMGLTVTVHLDEIEARKFVQSFGMADVVAVARIREAEES